MQTSGHGIHLCLALLTLAVFTADPFYGASKANSVEVAATSSRLSASWDQSQVRSGEM